MASRTLKGGERTMEHLRKIAEGMGGGEVSVGFLAGSTYPDGTPVGQVAFWNEFGHGGRFPAPARPFFRTMIRTESGSWPQKMAQLAKATDYDGPRVLALMGEDIKGALQQSINSFSSPALSSTTLRLRAKFGNQPHNITFGDVLEAQQDVADGKPLASGTQAHPLIWTGHLLNSVNYEVRT